MVTSVVLFSLTLHYLHGTMNVTLTPAWYGVKCTYHDEKGDQTANYLRPLFHFSIFLRVSSSDKSARYHSQNPL